MGGLIGFVWRLAMGFHAHQSRNDLWPAFVAQLTVTTCSAKRPNEAFVAIVRKHSILVEAQRCPSWDDPSGWVSIPFPSIVVVEAITVAAMRLAAIWNGTYTLGSSHSDLLQRLAWLEPAERANAQAGSPFLANNSLESKTRVAFAALFLLVER